MIGKIVSHYRILAPLGAGGMGLVYRAEDTRLGRQVAIKFLPPTLAANHDALERFQREARAASALNHPNICTLFDIGSVDNQPYIVMELLEGQPLSQRIGGKPLPAADVIEFGTEIAGALGAAHDKGIVHRDIKPANLFLTKLGQVKILDFGVAKLTHAGESAASAEAPTTPMSGEEVSGLTNPGLAIGTVAYMSPEQALGNDVDGRTDLFSLGIVLYEMATGVLPFSGKTAAAAFDAILHKNPAPISSLNPHLPAGLDAIITRALEKDRDVRYQTASDLRADLKRLARDSGSTIVVAATTGSGSPPLSPPPPARKRTWLWAAGAAIAAVIGAGAWWAAHRSKPITEKDTLVLADVTNATGDAVFDVTLKKALAVQLEQSPYLNIFSEQRMRDTLKLMGRPPDERISSAAAREICQRNGLKAMLTGSIAGMGKGYVVQLEAVNCASGDSIAREQVESEDKEHVLRAVGKAASAMRARLGESLSTIQKLDMPIEQATTSSLEAFQAYALGEAQRMRGAEVESIPFYERAVKLDPNFARAYGVLGVIYGNLRELGRAREYMKKAFALIDRVSEREKLYLQAHYYRSVTREVDKNIQTLNLAAQTYPRDPVTRINLSAAYDLTGEVENSIAAAREAIRLDPSLSNGYSNLAFGLMKLGRLDEAKAAARQGLDRGLEGVSLRIALLTVAMLQNDKSAVERETQWLLDKDVGGASWSMQASAAAGAGRLRQAVEFSRKAQDFAARRGFRGMAASMAAQETLWEAEYGKCEKARKAAVPANVDEGAQLLASAFAICGETAKAERFAGMLYADCPTDTLQNAVIIPAIHAAAALLQKQPARAIELLKSAVRYEREYPGVTYLRGLAQLEAGSAADAAAEFQKILNRPGYDGTYFDLGPLARVGLARADAKSGDTAKARKAYQDVLALWKDADPDVPLVVQVKKEYEKLQP